MAQSDGKGRFAGGLRVAEQYVLPVDRNRMVWWGLAAALAVVLVVAADLFLFGGDIVSAGPVSSGHAAIEEAGRCDACHEAFASVSDEKCSACHERFGSAFGVFAHEAHVLYRSADLGRLAGDPGDERLVCASCHPEHRGRDVRPVRAPDDRCTGCHPAVPSFEAHPEFAYAVLGARDRDGLVFGHVEHVRRLVAREELEAPETACLYCHHLESDERGFAPIDFDAHCGACHLTGFEETEMLPVRSASRPGVEPLDRIAARRTPGTAWARLESPEAYLREDGRVAKSPVLHADPWVMHNLRELRHVLRPAEGIAELLATTAEAAPEDAHALYLEAVGTLERYLDELRGRPEPEVQEDLRWARSVLAAVERRLADPFTPLDPARFERPEPPDVDLETLEAVTGVVDGLTAPCQACHRIEDATIARVQGSQSELRKARFAHGPHLIQRGCLSCHDVVPVAELWDSEAEVDPARDHAGLLNLPRVADCRVCHGSAARSACVDCHEYHPHKDRRPVLARRLEPVP